MTTASNPWLVLTIISGALVIIGIDMTVLNVALPQLALELDATNSEKLWMVNAYSLVMAGLLPGFGVLADRIGHRTVLVSGLVIFGLSSVMAALSPTPEVLIAARAFLAVGAALMLPATLSIVRLVFESDSDRAAAIGIWGAIWSGAAALGPIVGGLLLERFWWGSVFLINVPIVIVALIMVLFYVPQFPGNRKQHWDAISSLYLTGTLVSFLYGVKCLIKAEPDFTEFAISLVSGAIFSSLYIYRQRQQPSPLLDLNLFRNSKFSVGAAVALFSGFALIGLQYVLSQELQLAQNFTPLHAGLFLLPIAIASFVSGPMVGRIMIRVGIERIMTVMLLIATIGMVLYAVKGNVWGLTFDLAVLVLVGFGAGGSMAAASTAIMINAPDERAGMAGSVESIAYELGGTLGVAVMGSLTAAVFSRSFSPPDEAVLPAAARDSLDQALVALTGRLDEAGLSAIDDARSAFSDGTTASLFLATAVMFAMFLFIGVRILRSSAADR